MAQLDVLIILPLLLGLLPVIFFHYSFLIKFNMPSFFGVKKFRSKFLALKKQSVKQLS